MTGAKSRFGLDRQGMRHLGTRALEPVGAGALRACGPARRGRGRRRRQLLVKPAPTPAARRATNTSSRSPARRTRYGGATSTSRSTPSVSTACTSACSPISRGASCSSRISMPAPTRTIGCRCGWSPTALGTACFRATCSSARRSASSKSFEPAFTILHAPEFPRDPGVRRDQLRNLHLRQFRRAAGADRRHRLCRRDQEVASSAISISCCRRATCCRCMPRPMSARRATARSSSASPAPARRHCRPIVRAP